MRCTPIFAAAAILISLWSLAAPVRAMTVSSSGMQDYLLAEGMRFYRHNRPAEAIRVWEKILNDPLYGPCLYVLNARLYLKMKRPGRAERILKEFLAKYPTSPYIKLAREMLLQIQIRERRPEAVRRLRAMLVTASRKDRPRLLLQLARLEKARKEYERAAGYYTRLFLEYPATMEGLAAADELARLVFVGKAPPPRFTEAQQRARAKRLFRKGRFDLAAYTYKALLKKHPRDEDLRLKLARCLYGKRENHAAIRLLKKILRDTSSDAVRVRASHLLSLVYWRIDRDREFDAACRYVIAKGSPSRKRRALFNLAAHRMEKKRYTEAERYFKRILKLKPPLSQKVDVLWKLAWVDYSRKRYGAAVRAFRRVRKASPTSSIRNPSIYWEARSLMKLKRHKDAITLLKQVAKADPLGYYGIAARKILKAQRVATRNDSIRRPALKRLSLSPAERSNMVVKNALKLMDKGLFEFALLQLDTLPRSIRSSPAVAFLRAKAAHGAHKYRQAREILSANFGTMMKIPPAEAPKEFVEIAYPRVYKEVTIRHAKRYDLDPYLVWAVMRQESLYDASAVSPAGALGLMQVTPAATGLTRRRGRVPTRVIAEILDPKQNIAFGTRILGKNLKKFKGDLIPALAAYNADAKKVRQWVRRNGRMKPDEFVENIPYSETRLYVKKVLAGYNAYSFLHRRKDLAGLW